MNFLQNKYILLSQEAQVQMSPDVSAIIVGIINVSSALISSFLVDRAGRRLLLLTSIIGMTICTAALGAFYFIITNDPTATDYLGWLPLTALSIFLVAFSLGYGPVMWLMIGEIYSKDINAVVSPITGSFNWILAFVITFVFRPIADEIGNSNSFCYKIISESERLCFM